MTSVNSSEILNDDPTDLVEGLKQLSVARAQINSLRYINTDILPCSNMYISQ